MVDFRLSEEELMLQKLARDFARAEIMAAAAHHDETGEFPEAICRKAWEQGLMNLAMPEHCGGMALGSLPSTLIVEEMGYACSGIGTALEANNLACAPVIVAGSEALQKKILAPMAEQFKMASYAVTEPGAGSDVAGIRTKAEKRGDHWVIDGQKMWITNAAKADWYFVLAYTDAASGHRGMTGFVVPRETPGILVGKKEQNMGQRASDTRGITFEGVAVPEENIVGAVGEGFKVAMKAFDHTRPSVGSMAVGVARRAMDESIQYAKERKAFGRPIASFQAISFMIADMAKAIEAARMLVWQAAWQIDNGIRNSKVAAMAKCFAADECLRICTDAVQIFGGYGFNKEYPVEKLMRDAKVFQIYEGTSQIQRLIISRHVMGG